MDASPRYRLSAETAASRLVDGEVIAINVVNGRYFAMDGPAAVAWTHLTGGASSPEVATALQARYAVDAAVAGAAISTLTDRLLEEGLIDHIDGEGSPSPVDETLLDARPTVPEPWPGLELTTFRDMEDLLAFDPPLPIVDAPAPG